MASTDNREWPLWADVLAAWNHESPRDLEIIRFEAARHHPNRPWFDCRRNEQGATSSPQNTTAYHLCVVLPAVSADCLVAYKLYARCRERGEHHFAYHVLGPVFSAQGLGDRTWWNAAAQHVLPPLSRLIDWSASRDEQTQASAWRDVVAGAVQYWKALAEEWALVRLPEYLDPRSLDYREYSQFSAAQIEREERAEYERLKRKYDVRSAG